MTAKSYNEPRPWEIGNETYNSAEAQKNRSFQEYMSSTAHQREVQDLELAGLNPILSANKGSAMATGSTAQSSVSNTDKNRQAELGNTQIDLLKSQKTLNQANTAKSIAETAQKASQETRHWMNPFSWILGK